MQSTSGRTSIPRVRRARSSPANENTEKKEQSKISWLLRCRAMIQPSASESSLADQVSRILFHVVFRNSFGCVLI